MIRSLIIGLGVCMVVSFGSVSWAGSMPHSSNQTVGVRCSLSGSYQNCFDKVRVLASNKNNAIMVLGVTNDSAHPGGMCMWFKIKVFGSPTWIPGWCLTSLHGHSFLPTRKFSAVKGIQKAEGLAASLGMPVAPSTSVVSRFLEENRG